MINGFLQNNNKHRSKIIFLFSLAVFLVPIFVLADGLVPCEGSECTICDFAILMQRVLNFIITLSTVVAGILFAYAGLLYIFAGGDAEKVQKAHSIFYNVFVGLIIVLASWLIVSVIMKSLLSGNIQGPWTDWNTIPGCG